MAVSKEAIEFARNNKRQRGNLLEHKEDIEFLFNSRVQLDNIRLFLETEKSLKVSLVTVWRFINSNILKKTTHNNNVQEQTIIQPKQKLQTPKPMPKPMTFGGSQSKPRNPPTNENRLTDEGYKALVKKWGFDFRDVFEKDSFAELQRNMWVNNNPGQRLGWRDACHKIADIFKIKATTDAEREEVWLAFDYLYQDFIDGVVAARTA